MALGLLGVLDLSVITDRLISLLEESRDKSPLWTAAHPRFTIKVSGLMPETLRGEGDCQLSVYLYHVSQDSYQRNSPVFGRAVPIPAQPLSLNLFYIVTAFAKNAYVQEQQAMSIALRCFHENPFVRITEPIAGISVPEEFSLTMEIETVDKLGFIWQAFSAPFRLSAIYKVSVVFVTPDIPDTASPGVVKQLNVSAQAATGLRETKGQVFGTTRSVSFLTPASTALKPVRRTLELTPAVVAPGEQFELYGESLDKKAVFLVLPDGSESKVSDWISTNPRALPSGNRITLDLPGTVGPLPHSPPAGVYRLRAGEGAYRTTAAPFSVAAKVTVPPDANPPILAGPVFTVSGVGFIPGRTEVLLDDMPLTSVGNPPGPGEAQVTGDIITFQAPAEIAPGLHELGIRVNGVESAPAWWINI